MNRFLLFTILALLNIILFVCIRTFIPINELIYTSYSEQLSVERIQELLNVQKKWEWLGYILSSIVIIIRCSLVATALYLGNIFFQINIPFKKYFRFALYGEFIFILMLLIKFIWFYFNRDNITLEHVQYFYPLSLINFFDLSELDKWFIYPLQTLNLFELSYAFILALFIKKEIKIITAKSVEIVFSTYGVGLVIWMIFVSFLALNLN